MGSVGIRSSFIGQLMNGYDFSWTREYAGTRIRRFELWAQKSRYERNEVLESGQSMHSLLKSLEKEGLVNLQEAQPLFSQLNNPYSFILCLSLQQDAMKLLCHYKGQLLKVDDNFSSIVPIEKYFKKAESGQRIINLLKDREHKQWGAYMNAVSKCEQEKLFVGGKYIQEQYRAMKKGNEM